MAKAISSSPALKAAGQDNLGKFLLTNVSEKDLGEMNGELTNDLRKEVWKGVDHTSWERQLNAAGEQEITEAGKKMLADDPNTAGSLGMAIAEAVETHDWSPF